MQISRHWRLNAIRYRLEGVQYNDGSVSLQKRPQSDQNSTQDVVYSEKPASTEDSARKTDPAFAA